MSPKEISDNIMGKIEQGLCFHQMVAVLWNRKKTQYAEHFPIQEAAGEVYKPKRNEVKYEGLYCFGGKDQSGNCNNEVKFIELS